MLVSTTRSAPCPSQQPNLSRVPKQPRLVQGALACSSSRASFEKLLRSGSLGASAASWVSRSVASGSFSACTGRVEPLPPACLYKSACVTLSTLSKACYHTCRLGAAVELVDWGGPAHLLAALISRLPLSTCAPTFRDRSCRPLLPACLYKSASYPHAMAARVTLVPGIPEARPEGTCHTAPCLGKVWALSGLGSSLACSGLACPRLVCSGLACPRGDSCLPCIDSISLLG